MSEQSNTGVKHSRIRYTLVFTILTLLYVAALAVVAHPYAVKNLDNSNFKEHITEYKAQKDINTWTRTTSFLFAINGPIAIDRDIDGKGSDSLHTTLEALLLPLSKEELEKGLVTYIPKKTELIGVTESDSYIFVELSNDLLFSSNLDKAIEQIELTLEKAFNPNEIYIIVDKEIIN